MSRGNRSGRVHLRNDESGVDRHHPSRNKHSLIKLQEWFLPDETIFAKLKFHGNTSWSPSGLVWLAIWWAWSESRHLTDALTDAVKATHQVSTSSSLTTYQGFMKALVKWTPSFIDLISFVLQKRMQEIGGRFWRIHGWVPIAFDGSRNSASRTKKNEQAFCAPRYGKGKTARYRKKKTKGMRRTKNQKNKPQPQRPQIWITLMWHMGFRLPWTWRLGPSNSSERAHAIEMVETGQFPKNTLFCGDAGFVGYPLWSTILRHQGHFLVRVGANVDLLMETAEYRLLKNGVVLFWPKTLFQANRPPIRLRLVQVALGKTRAWMLTSVLNPHDLTPQQILRFYKMRWGVEIEFRGLKQTLDRAKLRSHNPQRLLAELNWSILAMAIAELFALKEQLSTRHDSRVLEPNKRSLAAIMRILRDCLRNLNEVPSLGSDLSTRLRTAVTDNYQRKASKKARYCPLNPDKKKLGDPNLRQLRPTERQKLRRLEGKTAM